MDVTGSQKIRGTRQLIFNMLLNPETLKNSIPGCESAEFVDLPIGRQLRLLISVSIPGLRKQHEVFLRTGEVVASSRIVFLSEPSGSSGSIKAVCTVDLTDDPLGTNLNYNAKAEMEGKIAAIPDFVLNGAVKVGLGQFFKNFEKQVSSVPA